MEYPEAGRIKEEVRSVVGRMRGKIFGDRQSRNCVEQIKTAL
jgi:hypothetical protein